MPKLSRDVFLRALDDLWHSSENNFAKHGAVHGHMVALDAMGRQLYFMQAPAGAPEATTRGIIPIPGPWLDHLDVIRAAFREHKAVAAILVGEAWMSRGDVGMETIRMNISPSDHPMSDEIAFVVGAWPREYIASGHYAVIVRDDRGENGRLSEPIAIGEGPAEFIVSWLGALLPQPH